jgi:hypothetical protein
MNIIINGELYKLWGNAHLPRLEEIINKEIINTKILREEFHKYVKGWMTGIKEIDLLFLFNLIVSCSF